MTNVITIEQVKNLKVGDLIPNCFGELKEVVSIHHKGYDINGKYFACFYQKFSDNSTISNTIKEGENYRIIK